MKGRSKVLTALLMLLWNFGVSAGEDDFSFVCKPHKIALISHDNEISAFPEGGNYSLLVRPNGVTGIGDDDQFIVAACKKTFEVGEKIVVVCRDKYVRDFVVLTTDTFELYRESTDGLEIGTGRCSRIGTSKELK